MSLQFNLRRWQQLSSPAGRRRPPDHSVPSSVFTVLTVFTVFTVFTVLTVLTVLSMQRDRLIFH